MANQPSTIKDQPSRLTAITWLFATLPLLGWWLTGLFDMDEGFYGAVVAEMNRRGEWITPYYNGQPWFEKPILLYWVAKPFMFIFGDWVGPRIPSILATLATYWLLAWFCRRHFGAQTSRWCLLVYASSVLVVGLGRLMMTDALLAFCLAGAFIFFWESLVGDRRWRLLSAFFLGLSVLAKGPVGLMLFVPVAAYTLWREREMRPAFRGWWLAGTVILLATAATWYLPAYLVNGDRFVQQFLIEQNLNRFTGGDLAHILPFPKEWPALLKIVAGSPYYILVLFVLTLPWSFYWRRAWIANNDRFGRFLTSWCLVPFVFFTISSAKLPHYVLPCCLPMAMIVGRWVSGSGEAPTPNPLPQFPDNLESTANPLAAKPREGALVLRFPWITAAVVAVLVNVAFVAYYRLPAAGATSEADQIAFYVRDHIAAGEHVVAYQMGRREHEMGTGRLKIMETVHPSLVMYLLAAPAVDIEKPVRELDDFSALVSDPSPQWVITRWNRLGAIDFVYAKDAGRPLRLVQTVDAPNLYRLFYMPSRR